jgi:hypothetical protein
MTKCLVCKTELCSSPPRRTKRQRHPDVRQILQNLNTLIMHLAPNKYALSVSVRVQVAVVGKNEQFGSFAW